MDWRNGTIDASITIRSWWQRINVPRYDDSFTFSPRPTFSRHATRRPPWFVHESFDVRLATEHSTLLDRNQIRIRGFSSSLVHVQTMQIDTLDDTKRLIYNHVKRDTHIRKKKYVCPFDMGEFSITFPMRIDPFSIGIVHDFPPRHLLRPVFARSMRKGDAFVDSSLGMVTTIVGSISIGCCMSASASIVQVGKKT